tara:strand:- start:953 stop:2803 length:1851 start_codon:yes stop_codon:yes gene_type:complete
MNEKPLGINKNDFTVRSILFLIVVVAFFFRAYEFNTDLFIPETYCIYNGLRLHILEFFNFGDHISENFFKSFFGGLSGLRYPISGYIFSTVYGWLGIPINEFWIRFFYIFLGMLCVIGTYFLGQKLLDRQAGLLGAAILAINHHQVEISRHEGAQIMVTFIVLACVMSLIYYRNKQTWFRRTLLSILIATVSGMESIMMLPLIVIYQLMLFVAPESSYSKRLVGCFRYLLSKENILIWFPCFLMLLINAYVYLRVGMSNIGLFAYILYKQKVAFSGQTLFDSQIWNIESYRHFLSPEFLFCSLAAFIFLIDLHRQKIFLLSKLLIFSGVGFFYSMFWFFVSGGSNYNHFIVEPLNALFLATIWISVIRLITEKIKGAHTSFFLYAVLALFITTSAQDELQSVLKRQNLIHPLKSIGYYIHEYGGGNPSAYLMLTCEDAYVLASSEFYFGTQIMDMEADYNAPRKLFCQGSKSIKETLEAYKLNDFDFYIAIYSFAVSEPRISNSFRKPYTPNGSEKLNAQKKELQSQGVKSVGVVRNRGLILGEIFSRRDVPFKDMEIDDYDPLWDEKYANIAGIVKTKWSGQAGTWGNLWSEKTGIQLIQTSLLNPDAVGLAPKN